MRESLRKQGVSTVFGLIGSAGMEIYDALVLSEPAVSLIGVRDERTGTHMATDMRVLRARSASSSPARTGTRATNLVTGLAQAAAAYSPVVALAGSLSSAHIYRNTFQEVDQQALFWSGDLEDMDSRPARRIPEMMTEAFRTALAPRRGPVALNLPRDLLAESFEIDPAAPTASSGTVSAGIAAGEAEAVQRAARLLGGAERPLIIAGGGVKTVARMRWQLRSPNVLTLRSPPSPGHGDTMPCDYRLYAGQVGPRGNKVASRLALEADVILALGHARLRYNVLSSTTSGAMRESFKSISSRRRSDGSFRSRSASGGAQRWSHGS